MNSSWLMYSSPVSGSLTALLKNRDLVWDDSWTGSSEPTRVSLTASLTAVILDAIFCWDGLLSSRAPAGSSRV